MNKVNSARGVCVGVVVVAFANVGTTWAQYDEMPHRLHERISRTLVDEGFPSAAAAFDTEIKITASDGAANDRFGVAVAVSGGTAIVGAYSDDDNGIDSGSAYVYRRDQGGVDNWGLVTKITASDGAAGDTFGISVAISGDTAIVAAFNDDDNGTNSGSAYVYRRDQGGVDNWGEVTKIAASDGAAADRFGGSVAISGDTAIVGAWRDDDNGSDSGSAYVYWRDQGGADNWGQVTKITASDGAANDRFGVSVAVSGDTAIVGAYQDDDHGSGSGSAYVYRRDQGGADNWGQVTKITASDGAVSDFFGYSVAVSGDTAIVGAFGDDDNGPASGSAYVYMRDQGGADNWGLVTKITASDGGIEHVFGVSVAISGDTAIVGAFNDDHNGPASGSAYVYLRDQGGFDNWGEVTKITASDGAAADFFGYSVAVSGGTAIVGASFDDDNGADSGSAYVFANRSSILLLPEELKVIRGRQVAGELADLFESDDLRTVFQPGLALDTNEPPVWLILDATSPTDTPSILEFTLETQVDTPDVTQTVELFNYALHQFEQVDSRITSVNEDAVVEIVVDNDPGRFIDPETWEVKAQLTWKPGRLVLVYPWNLGIDQATWRVTP